MGYEEAFRIAGLTYFGKGYPRKASHWRGKHNGQPAIVLGNGRTRLAFDTAWFENKAVILACNSYFADVLEGKVNPPDYLGAVDHKISAAIYESGYADNHNTLLSVANLARIATDGGGRLAEQKHLIEMDYHPNFNCGAEMVQFAAMCGCDPIILFGFDGPGDTPEDVNNVYAGQPYCEATHATPSPGLWQIRLVMKRFPRKYFQVGNDWLQPMETIGYSFARDLIGESGCNQSITSVTSTEILPR